MDQPDSEGNSIVAGADENTQVPIDQILRRIETGLGALDKTTLRMQSLESRLEEVVRELERLRSGFEGEGGRMSVKEHFIALDQQIISQREKTERLEKSLEKHGNRIWALMVAFIMLLLGLVGEIFSRVTGGK